MRLRLDVEGAFRPIHVVRERKIFQGERIVLDVLLPLPAIQLLLIGPKIRSGERHAKSHLAVETTRHRVDQRHAVGINGREVGGLLATMVPEGDSNTRRGDGGLEVGDRLAVRLQASVVVLTVVQERYAVVLQKSLHVTTEVTGIGADRRQLKVGWGGVVAAGGRKAELNSLIELLRRGKELQLLARLGVTIVGCLGVEDWGLGRVRGASSRNGLRV